MLGVTSGDAQPLEVSARRLVRRAGRSGVHVGQVCSRSEGVSAGAPTYPERVEPPSDADDRVIENRRVHGGGSLIGGDDVAELRSLLRRRDTAARSLGLALLRSWSADDLDELAGLAVLEAAGASYPTVKGSSAHPGEVLVALLWDSPYLTPAVEVLRVYSTAGERSRRALIHLLALRSDDDGIDALEQIFGQASASRVPPVATSPLLEPLGDHPDRGRVVALLLLALSCDGWVWHASDLLGRLESRSPSPTDVREQIIAKVTDVALPLVDVCNRSMRRSSSGTDAARSDRQTLASLARLLDQFPEVEAVTVLRVMLGSADPRVAAMAAGRLHSRGVEIAAERIRLIARDPVARVDLLDLWPGSVMDDMSDQSGGRLDSPGAPFDDVALAEGILIRWLGDVTELGRAPDEIEHICTVDDPDDSARPVFLFRFRMHSPHWSSARGWMVAMSGPQTYTCYTAEDECSIGDHVGAMLSALRDWPGACDDPGAGASRIADDNRDDDGGGDNLDGGDRDGGDGGGEGQV